MEKINTFEEVIYYLKQNVIVTSNGKDTFYYANNKITHKFSGSSYHIDLNTFVDLYKDKTFYLIEDNSTYIDEEKDKDYYEKYPK